MPNNSRLKKLPRKNDTGAISSTAMRSSYSRYKKVTRVRRLRYTGVLFSGMSTHSADALPHKPFAEANHSGEHETPGGRDEVTHPGAAVIHAMADAREMHNSDDDLQNAIERHYDVTGPVHEVHQRHPVEVRIVPRLLGREEFQASQDSRSHETEKTAIHPVLMLSRADEPDNRDREEQARERREDYVSEPTGQIHDSVLEHHEALHHLLHE